MNEKRFLYIPIEVKVRELHSRSLLAMVAAERGWTTVIGREDELGFLLRGGFLPQGVVLEKSVQPTKLRKLQRLVDAGFIIVSQDEESGLLSPSYSHFARQRFSHETLNLISRQYFWGNFDRQGCASYYPQFEDRFFVTGSPRVDLWRADLAPFYAEEVAQLRKMYGEYILVPSSSLGRIFHPRGVEAQLVKKRRIGHVRTERDEAEYWKKVEYQRQFSRLLRDALVAVSRHHPEHTIIVRPHPAEDPNGWRGLIGDHPRIIVERSGDIASWLAGARAVIHNGSTTGVQAVIMGKPVLAFRPIDSPFEREIPNNVSIECRSEQELLAQVDRFVCSEVTPEEAIDPDHLPHVLKERYTNISGPLAADRMVDALPNPVDGDPAWISRERMIGPMIRLRTAAQRSYGFIRRRTEHPADHKFRSLRHQTLLDIQSRFQWTLGRFGELRFRHLGRTIYIVTR